MSVRLSRIPIVGQHFGVAAMVIQNPIIPARHVIVHKPCLRGDCLIKTYCNQESGSTILSITSKPPREEVHRKLERAWADWYLEHYTSMSWRFWLSGDISASIPVHPEDVFSSSWLFLTCYSSQSGCVLSNVHVYYSWTSEQSNRHLWPCNNLGPFSTNNPMANPIQPTVSSKEHN